MEVEVALHARVMGGSRDEPDWEEALRDSEEAGHHGNPDSDC